MLRVLRRIGDLIDRIEVLAAALAGTLILFLVLAVSYEIVMRYFFNRPPVWTVEVSRYILLYITFLAAAWVLKQEAHVRIDLVLNRLKPENQALLCMVTSVVSALVFLAITWYALEATLDDYRIWYRIESELRTPRFIVLATIPVGSLLFSIGFIRQSCGYFSRWKNGRRRKGR